MTIVNWEGHTTVFGGPVLGSQRSIDWLEYVYTEVGHFAVIQSAYHTGYPPSAGTHDKDACYDLTRIDGKDWLESQAAYRAHGGGAFYRTPSQGFSSEHVHVVVLGYTDPWHSPYDCDCVGVFVPGQVVDYYNHALGLVDHHDPGDDPTWHPDDIDATIAEFERWRRERDDMNLNDQIPGTDMTVGDAFRASIRTEQRVIRGNTILRNSAKDIDDIVEALGKFRENVAARDAALAADLDKTLEKIRAVKKALDTADQEPTP